ncbi:hypothetical protein RF11_07932 [Thelohanellus kitauei]|uniref:Tc1-like transposase DDE domain-containing protein n=1 Tax=Thelohanellus kitauei TaxID=669202 RepID=A0A0C2MKB4_THEKT|nr:hypothetical protein RF11_07932 [Thelohanellus kitauei]
MDACPLELLTEQYPPLNEEHLCVYFMEVFEHFLSSGIHECIFIMDNGPDHAAREWPHGNIPSTILAFPQPIKNLFSKWKKTVKTSSPRSEADLFNQCTQAIPLNETPIKPYPMKVFLKDGISLVKGSILMKGREHLASRKNDAVKISMNPTTKYAAFITGHIIRVPIFIRKLGTIIKKCELKKRSTGENV